MFSCSRLFNHALRPFGSCRNQKAGKSHTSTQAKKPKSPSAPNCAGCQSEQPSAPTRGQTACGRAHGKKAQITLRAHCAGYQLLINPCTKARTNGPRPCAWQKSLNHPPRPLRGVATSNSPLHQSAGKRPAAVRGKKAQITLRAQLREVSTSNNPLHQSADKRPVAARIKRRAALKLISVRPPSEISRQSRPKFSCSRGLRQSA